MNITDFDCQNKAGNESKTRNGVTMKTHKEQYGKRMRFIIAQLTGILFLPLIAMAGPTLTDYYWMTNSAVRCVSGSFSDSSKWIGGAVPGELSLARFFYRGPTSGDGGYTVTLPTMETKATLCIYARNDIPIVFDGSGSIFHATSTDANNYGEHFLSIYGGGTAPDEGKEQAYFMNSSFRGGYKLTDAVLYRT